MVDAGLFVYLAAWYAGNYYYNVYNKLAAKAAGGAEFAFTLATIQLLVGCVYAIFLWVAPEARAKPNITLQQFLSFAPLGLAAAAAHAGAVFAMSAGAVSFGQVIKAAEPAFAAAIGYLVYAKAEPKAKILCLPIIIGGICLASVEELDFAWGALIAACTANVASAFRGAENKKMKKAVAGMSTGNMYAITTLWATVMLIPSIFISGEFAKKDEFIEMWKADGKKGSAGNLQYNTIMSGVTFYLYNEVSTLALDKISGVTHSVANTAKRAIIIVGCAIAFGESMAPLKMAGCAIAIFGTFIYAVVGNAPATKPKTN